MKALKKTLIVVVITSVSLVGFRTVTYNKPEQDTKKMEVTLNKMMLERLNREKSIDLINGLK